MSFITQYMINQGVPQETIILLLMLPIFTTIIVFARQIIGIKGFGIYTPLIIAFIFLATGLKYGLVLFVIILLIGTLLRLLAKRLRLLYLPRMSIVLIGITLTILILLLGGAYLEQKNLIAVSAFGILIMVVLVEKFIALQIKQEAKKTIILILETLALSIICYWIASWPWFQNLTLAYPLWIILGALIVNILLGKWTGLRFSEYSRFWEVIKNIEPAEKK
ncbi:MAG: hypothetical protein CMI55_02750 [Parcubacteria group bacterium]|jgi:hypothetical protein|nr:hypothetical protein [Parcubacteria group bacterium]|tara:strand:+ start:2945 stop:3607 length:663 start_codon:yes stop_codon:yes gene_type:complete